MGKEGGEAGRPPPRFLLTSIFDELKNSVKVKNSTKLDDFSKFIDIYNIIIDLDARDGILSVMNSEGFSHF